MRSFEKGKDKIQKICDQLRDEVLEPAKKEAQTILQEAKKRKEEIETEAEHHREELIKQARHQIEQERSIFRSSLEQAVKQTLESLRQEIEHLFSANLQNLLSRPLADPKVIADFINGIVKAIQKEGLTTDLTALIPRLVSADAVNTLLLEEVRKQIKEKPLQVGHFAGGVQIKLVDKKMIIDLSDEAIKELLETYIRKDFRRLIFA